jgi:LuxR family maltose regulon positive regulatory protein
MDDHDQLAGAASPLLATKLFVPKLRDGQVKRSGPAQRLARGVRQKLTVLSAPAGFGKTSLLGEWAEAAGHGAIAWVSLDSGDNDPARFWTYVLAALQRLDPAIGLGAFAVLQSAQHAPLEFVVTSLINQIGERADDIVIVLDDYHLIEEPAIHDSVEYLLENAPPQLHLVIASRSDPPLPLSRLRSRGELTEIRASDLRFALGETEEFLAKSMGLELAGPDLELLTRRTEGWIAGIQLAALSMQQQEDVTGFVRSFAGDDRYIVDYLVEEVLQRQSEPVRSFLLQTSVLDRLSGSLCDAVTGGHDGNERLAELERANLFVTPLDSKREWYRYHHLFAEVLSVHLKAAHPHEVPELHSRASRWFAARGLFADAVRHAAAGDDPERSGELVELAGQEMRRIRQEATLLRWQMSLPEAVISRRPVLCMDYAFTLLSTGHIDDSEQWLRKAEDWIASLQDQNHPEMLVADWEAFHQLPGSISVARAGMALAHDDLLTAAEFAERALGQLQPDDHFRVGAASSILGLVAWSEGDIEPARALYERGMMNLRRAGYVTDSIGGSASLGDIQICQGKLGEARTTYEQALKHAADAGVPAMRGTADLHVGLSEVFLERNDLALAARHLQIAREQGDHTGFPQFPWRWCAAMAQVSAAQKQFEIALDLLRRAEESYVSDFHPDVRPISTQIARVWLAQGRLDEALDWATKQRSSEAESDDVRFVHEYAQVTRARILIALYRRDHLVRSATRATDILDNLIERARQSRRFGSVIELSVVQAMSYQATGEMARALEHLEVALRHASPERYVRVFVGEGEPMQSLLRHAAARGMSSEYVRYLLSQFAAPVSNGEGAMRLVEPLTARELEILRLIAAGMKNDEIANHLFISTATVKRHIANAYGKLGVNQRKHAIERVRELNLL